MQESKLKSISIPKTTPTRYITGLEALNLPAPEGTTGDWHFYSVFYSDIAREAMLAGEGAGFSTNHIYGQYGIYECGDILARKKLIDRVADKVYAANHYRAILDLVYRSLKSRGKVLGLIGAAEDWLDTDEQKDFLLKKAQEMLPHLNIKEQNELKKWIAREQQPGYRS